jgi:hypothetical protein
MIESTLLELASSRLYALDKTEMMMAKFSIEIHGPGLEYGVGQINKTQHDYWELNEYDLPLALNDKYDYKQNKTPKSCQLKKYYNEYDDVASFLGPLSDSCIIKIFNEDGGLVFNKSFNDIRSDIEENDGDVDEFTENEDEFHVINQYNVDGYYLRWRLFGNGIYFRGEFNDSSFDLNKLKIITYDLDNDYIVHNVLYDEEEVVDNGGEWSYSSQEFDVGFNESP